MTVYMRRIGVAGDDALETVEGFFSKLTSDLQRKLRRYIISAWMRLDEMKILSAVCLSVELFGVFEFFVCSLQSTIYSRHPFLVFSFIIAADISERALTATAALS